MIERMWHGRVPKEKAALTGSLLKQDGNEVTQTFWNDYESIKQFA